MVGVYNGPALHHYRRESELVILLNTVCCSKQGILKSAAERRHKIIMAHGDGQQPLMEWLVFAESERLHKGCTSDEAYTIAFIPIIGGGGNRTDSRRFRW